MSVMLVPPITQPPTIVYPESNGKPMAETDTHKAIPLRRLRPLCSSSLARQTTSVALAPLARTTQALAAEIEQLKAELARRNP
jgi:hypothetical protein